MSEEPALPEAPAEADLELPPGPPRPRRLGLPLVLATVLAPLLLVLAWRIATWPDVAALATRNPATTAFIERYREARREAGRADAVDWQPVPYGRISPHLKRAVLVAEDIDFFSHHGFAWSEMRNALSQAWEEREMPRGASTLTQQLAKNLWLTPSRNPLRKIEEAILTWQLERDLPKRRILELYLNVVELGPGLYGAEAASRRYFGKSAAELTPEEAAELAAGLPSPDRWYPGSTSRAYRRRVAIVLRRMDKAQFLWREI